MIILNKSWLAVALPLLPLHLSLFQLRHGKHVFFNIDIVFWVFDGKNGFMVSLYVVHIQFFGYPEAIRFFDIRLKELTMQFAEFVVVFNF
jgi:hypothetical protein